MATLLQILQFADRINDPELQAVCRQVIGEVAARAKRRNVGFWTIDVISKWVGRPPGDPVVLDCIQMLAAKSERQLLDMHFVFFDPTRPDDVGELISDEELKEAYQAGYLIDPSTGGAIADFERFLLPYFEPAAGLNLQ